MSQAHKVTYRDVKDQILGRICDKSWPAGTLLPGEVELASQFGCARATVNRAMRELAEEGIIDRKRKAGTRVVNAPRRHIKLEIPLVSQEIEQSGAVYRYALVSRTLVAAPSWLSARIGLEPEAEVLNLQTMHYANNAPFQFEDRWISTKNLPAVLEVDFSKVCPEEWLQAEAPCTQADVSFTAATVDVRMARFMSMVVGEAALTTDLTAWVDNQPLTFAQKTFAGGYRLSSNF